MAKLGVHGILKTAKEILAEHPSGVSFKELVKTIYTQHPETPYLTVRNSISGLPKEFPHEVTKPSRGIYQLTTITEDVPEEEEAQEQTTARAAEAKFYDSFADWLRDELEEVTEASTLGGAGMKTKWGTPDVVGTYKPLPEQMYKFPTEIVAAEMKIDPKQSVVAFGQAVAYRLFAHKSYLVMPDTLGDDELGRLEALSLIFGVGLVLFTVDLEHPNYTIRCRAQRFSPDAFYVNEFMQRLTIFRLDIFRHLFG